MVVRNTEELMEDVKEYSKFVFSEKKRLFTNSMKNSKIETKEMTNIVKK